MKVLTTARTRLEPLVVAHAESMFPVLGDASLYRHLDRSPPTSLEQVREKYVQLARHRSPDGRDRWLNWIVIVDEEAIGFVQATVQPDTSSWIAYFLARAHQGRGYATETTHAMLDHLPEAHGVTRFLAMVEADNAASVGVLDRTGFRRACAGEERGHAMTASELLYVRGIERG